LPNSVADFFYSLTGDKVDLPLREGKLAHRGIEHFIFFHHEPLGPIRLEELDLGRTGYAGSVARLRLLFWIAERGHRVDLVGNVQDGVRRGVRARSGYQGLEAALADAGDAGAVLVLNNLPTEMEWNRIRRLGAGPLMRLAWVGNHLNSVWMRRLARGELDGAVCVSQWQRETFRIFPRFERIEVSYCGVDLDLIEQVCPSSFDAPVVLSISIPRRSKGFHNLLSAWRMVRAARPDARLRVCGSARMHWPDLVLGKTGILDADLEADFPDFFGDYPKSADRFGIELMGMCSLPQVHADLRGAAVAVVNCNRRGAVETYCRTAVEAQLCGVPVVGAYAGSLPEVVADGKTGLLVKEQTASAIADAILLLLNDSALRARMATEGSRWARPLGDLRSIAADWEAIAERAWKGQPAPAAARPVPDLLRGFGVGRARTWLRERLRETQILERDRAG